MAERVKWIDIAKGIGIVSVVYGHCTQSLCNELFLYIYSYHMPLFFMLSGLCFNNEKYLQKSNISEFWKKRIMQLVIPLFTSMVLFCGLFELFGLGTYSFEKLCSGTWPPAMWFIFSLLVIEIVYWACHLGIRYVFPHLTSLHLNQTLLPTSLILAIIVTEIPLQWPLGLSSVPAGMLFFVSGILLRPHMGTYVEKFQHLKNKHLFCAATLIVPLIYVLFLKTPINLSEGILPYHAILPLCMAYWGSFAIIMLSILIASQQHFVHKFLTYLGQNTLIILMFHFFYLQVSTQYLRPLLGGVGTEPLTVWIWIFLTIPLVNKFAPFLAGKGFNFHQNSHK